MKVEKLLILWEQDKLNQQEILVPVQYRVLRRCDGRMQDGSRCILPASWEITLFYDGKTVAHYHFCAKHLKKWEDALRRDEERGVVSCRWSWKKKRIASPQTLRRWLKMAIIMRNLDL